MKTNTYFKVEYVDTNQFDQPFTNSETFSSLSSARKFAQKAFVGYEPVTILQVTETVLEKIESKA